jgi:hypothetical protein
MYDIYLLIKKDVEKRPTAKQLILHKVMEKRRETNILERKLLEQEKEIKKLREEKKKNIQV